MSGTANLGGFKSGCTSNLVVADGVLNAPDYTRTCSCAYQNQTSLALVHMSDMEMWTVNHAATLLKAGQKVGQVGVNFGAPGDRAPTMGCSGSNIPMRVANRCLCQSNFRVRRNSTATIRPSWQPLNFPGYMHRVSKEPMAWPFR